MPGFKVSRDPLFAEKLEDVVGLYLSPPQHAIVLCCDEKSQVQALDRTQPGLPPTTAALPAAVVTLPKGLSGPTARRLGHRRSPNGRVAAAPG